ncbi:putative MFS family arabinose efflux permease [Kitasatospora cineracea]|uniref:Putative MFS family arabinose efflux permease n=1 Tax=Kitasatospora cineracea TaxID=88074 RepID=A0A8G1X9G3_9ACTN|nr:putative MFS family arabinose efflux permease [Kitasatospora cineracea]
MLLGASVLANTGDGVLRTGLLLVVAHLTGSVNASSLVMAVSTVPWLLFGIPAGLLADRAGRKGLMVAADGARALLILGIGAAAWAGALSLPLLLALAFLVGTAETVFNTSSETVLPTVVPAAELARANGQLATTVRVTGQFVAPALAGWLTALAAPVTFLVAGAGYLGSMLRLTALPPGTGRVPGPERAERGGAEWGTAERGGAGRSGVWDGPAFLLRNRVVRVITLAGVLTTLANTSFLALFVVYATSGPLHLGDAGYGVLLSSVGVGTAFGSLTAHRAERRFGSAPVLCATRLGWGLVFTAPVFLHGPALFAAMTVGSGLGGMWGVLTVTIRQRLTPPRIRGAVGGAYRAAIMSAMPAGAAVGLLLQRLLGTPGTFLLFGAGMVALAVPVWRAVTAEQPGAEQPGVERPGPEGPERPEGERAGRHPRTRRRAARSGQ